MGDVIQSGAKPDGVVAEIMMGAKGATAEGNTPEETQTVKDVEKMFQKAKQWKETWGKDANRFWNLWEGNHYKGKIVRTITQAVINQVWSSVETILGHVADSLPEPAATSRTPEFKDKAKIVTKWLKYLGDRNNVEQEIQHPVRSACVTGAGWFSVEWDEQADNGRGDVKIEPVDDKFMFPAPYARNIKECLYLIEAKNVPREWVVKLWPDKADAISPSPKDPSLTNVRQYSEGNKDGLSPDFALLTNTQGTDSRWSGSSSGGGAKKSDLVTFIKAYIRQDDGPMRLVCIANGVLLQDGESPYDDDDFPYVVFNVIPTLDGINGRSLIQFIEGLQELLNQAVSLLLDQQRFASDPMLVVASQNLEDGQLVDNRPGTVLPDSTEGVNGYNWLQAPGFNAAWLQIQQIVNDYMDSVLGRVDILKGERPAGVNTLGGLEIIRDEANVRMRTMIRWIRASVKRMYLLALSRLRQFAKEERIIRITGKMGKEEFVKVNPVTGVNMDGSLSQDETIPENAEFEIQFAKDVPGGKQAQIELALTLAQTPAEDGLPMVDRQYVLEVSEIEDAPEILERMAQSGQAQMNAEEALMKQQGGGAGGGPPQPPIDVADTFMSLFRGAA